MQDMKRLLKYLGPYRKDMLIGALLIFVETCFELFIPVLIADLKSATLGVQGATELATVALLANVIREMIALFGTPTLARWGGRLVPISVAGINSMDVCLPMIVRNTTRGEELIPIAVLHGIVLEVSVPILINAFC